MSRTTILITGANGFAGSELVGYFAGKGWRVIGLVRNPGDCKPQENVEYAAFDLARPIDGKLFQGVDYVVHTAYVKFDRRHPDAMEVNVAGARAVHDAAQKYGVKRSVFMSSMSAHKAAVSVYGRQKLAIESIFNTKKDTVLRCGLIIGKGGIVRQMVGFLRAKRIVPLVDGGRQPLQIISIPNLAQVIDNIFQNNLSGLYTVANPEVYSYKYLYETIGKRLKVRLIFVPVPFIVLLAIMRIISFLRIPLPVNEDNLWGLKMLRSADNKKDIQKVGVKLDGLDQALERTGIVK